MPRLKSLLLIAIWAAIPCCRLAAGGEAAALSPASPPLAVVRAAEAETLRSVMATRPLQALRLDATGISGALPGARLGFDSLAAVLSGLAENNAANIWYALSQKRKSVLALIGAAGWDMPGPGPDASRGELVRALAAMGLNLGRVDMETERLASGRTRLIFTPDPEAREEMLGGSDFRNADGGWQASLRAFLAHDADAVGLWATTRPVLGLLSLAAGIDIQRELAGRKLGVPAWAQLELRNNGGNLGFLLKTADILPRDEALTEQNPVLIRSHDAPLLEVNIPLSPAARRRLIDPYRHIFLIANLNPAALVPRTASLSFRRGGEDALSWRVVCLMPESKSFREHFRRVLSWLDTLQQAKEPVLTMTDITLPAAAAAVELRIAGQTFVMGVVEKEAEALLILVPSRDDWPPAIALEHNVPPHLARWTANPDPATRRDIAARLARHTSASGNRPRLDAGRWEELLPESDTGLLTQEKGELLLQSESSLIAAILPYLYAEIH